MNAYDRNVAIFSCIISFIAGMALILGMLWVKFNNPNWWAWFRQL